jgi:hypothetical protein
MSGSSPAIDSDWITEKEIANALQGGAYCQDLPGRSDGQFSLFIGERSIGACHIHLERDFGRRKDLIIKWVDEALVLNAAFITLDTAEI